MMNNVFTNTYIIIIIIKCYVYIKTSNLGIHTKLVSELKNFW